MSFTPTQAVAGLSELRMSWAAWRPSSAIALSVVGVDRPDMHVQRRSRAFAGGLCPFDAGDPCSSTLRAH